MSSETSPARRGCEPQTDSALCRGMGGTLGDAPQFPHLLQSLGQLLE